jgi:enoyl-CoA hydratase/carnithine racemase
LFNELPVLFIAEVDGLAVGGGNEFAVNMDMRFAGPKARFGVPEVAGGVVHGGGLQKLTHIIGPGRALEMMTSARAVTSLEAERICLANRSFGSSQALRNYIDVLASRIAMFPRGGIAATKQGVQECLDGSGGMGKDMQRLGQLARTEESQKSISRLIELGHDHTRSEFELGLPDTEEHLWS